MSCQEHQREQRVCSATLAITYIRTRLTVLRKCKQCHLLLEFLIVFVVAAVCVFVCALHMFLYLQFGQVFVYKQNWSRKRRRIPNNCFVYIFKHPVYVTFAQKTSNLPETIKDIANINSKTKQKQINLNKNRNSYC